MTHTSNFTEGKILSPLLKFTVPILIAQFLQTMYGAVDLLVVGQFSNAAEVSAVSTGSQIMNLVTQVVAGITMGVTILLGQKLGEGKSKEAGNVVGSAISIFSYVVVFLTIVLILFASPISKFMNAPDDAFNSTVKYVSICSAGSIFIVSYNVFGGIFRGLGDSKTPLITVAIACFVNIVCDLLFVGVFNLAATGAALATVFAQAISVILSILLIKKQGLAFEFSKQSIKFHKGITRKIIKYGMPIALQSGLVNISFLFIMMIGNSMGVIESAGMGVAQKLVGFIMLIPISISQSVSTFVAQNFGAKKYDRAKKVLLYSISISFVFGVAMFLFTFFEGNILSSTFSNDPAVIDASWDYLKSYGVDCLFTAIMFSMVGYFNGCGKTTFVMIQGLVGAFLVRIPASYILSQIQPVTLFKVGLATPLSTFVQVILCLIYFVIISKKLKNEKIVEDNFSNVM